MLRQIAIIKQRIKVTSQELINSNSMYVAQASETLEKCALSLNEKFSIAEYVKKSWNVINLTFNQLQWNTNT